MVGRWPTFLCTLINPAPSNRFNEMLAASLLILNKLKDFLVSLNNSLWVIPCNHQIARATFKVFPGNSAALLNQSIGTGPRRNNFFVGLGINFPVFKSSCNRFSEPIKFIAFNVYIYPPTYLLNNLLKNVRVLQQPAGRCYTFKHVVAVFLTIKFITFSHITAPLLSI